MNYAFSKDDHEVEISAPMEGFMNYPDGSPVIKLGKMVITFSFSFLFVSSFFFLFFFSQFLFLFLSFFFFFLFLFLIFPVVRFIILWLLRQVVNYRSKRNGHQTARGRSEDTFSNLSLNRSTPMTMTI